MSKCKQDKARQYVYNTLTHTVEIESLKMKVKEIFRTAIKPVKKGFDRYTCELEISGSLHKHYFGNNCGPFYFNELQREIIYLSQRFKLDPFKAKFENLELGLNLTTDCNPAAIFWDIITYKGHTFNRYTDSRAGRYCSMKSDFEIKVYNKGFIEQIPENVLRFELHYYRMRVLNAAGIKFLSDLQNKVKVYSLLKYLKDVWANLVIYPSTAISNVNLTIDEKEFLNRYRSEVAWMELYKTVSRQTIMNYRERIRNIDKRLGDNVHARVDALIAQEWERLFIEREVMVKGVWDAKVVTIVSGVQNDWGLTNVSGVQNQPKLTFVSGVQSTKVDVCTVKIKVSNVNAEFAIKKRVCQTCGNDITRMVSSSNFCSESCLMKRKRVKLKWDKSVVTA